MSNTFDDLGGLFATWKTVSAPEPTVEISTPKSKFDSFVDAMQNTSFWRQKPQQQTQDNDQTWFKSTDVKSTPPTTTGTQNIDWKSKDLATILKENGLEGIVRITSGFRDHNVGKAGNKSNHRKKNDYGHSMAYDIAPGQGYTFQTMYEKLKGNQNFMSWLNGNGFNINDETTKDALAKTGGTGAHFHIGPDHFNVYKGQQGLDTSLFAKYQAVGDPSQKVARATPDFSPNDSTSTMRFRMPETKEKPKDNNQSWFKNTEIKTPEITTGTTTYQSTPYEVQQNANFDADLAKYGTSDIFKNHQNFWRRLAQSESSFRPNITNKQGAYGYFQLMPNASTGKSVESQFKDAERLMQQHMRLISDEDRKAAQALGITEEGLMAGVWLGGPGGVKNALHKGANAADANGTSVMSYMKKFSS